MQINRLFEIVYILFDRKTVTARELAERFEVSQRTIYRDIDTLGMAGIPIYTNKGKGGGISILPEYVLNKSLLSDTEQSQILGALQSLRALNAANVDPVLNKLAAIFNKNNTAWIDVDFSRWGSDDSEREKFDVLKGSILERKIIEFNYFNSCGEKSKRTVEPLRLVFKGQDWYLYGFCKLKNDFRMFKITRMRNVIALNENYDRDIPQDIWTDSSDKYKKKMVTLVLKVDGNMAYRVFDEFSTENINTNQDGSFTVETIMPEGDWIYGYIMSYGENAEVLEPEYIRNEIIDKNKRLLKKYLK